MQEIKPLTGLRGVAALMVMIYHFSWFWIPSGIVKIAINHMYLMVDLFFILSGYIMARQYGAVFVRWPGTITFWSFLAHRIARIWPLYAVTTVAATLVVQPEWARTAQNFSANLAMIQSWGLADSMNAPGWSISTEWTAYLLFPLLVPLCLRGSWIRAASAGVMAVASIVGLSLTPTEWLAQAIQTGPLDIHSWQTPAPILRCVADFTVGLLTFRAMRNPRIAGAVGSPLASLLIAPGLLVLTVLQHTDVAIVLLFPALIAALSAGRGPVCTALASVPVHSLGILSYSIYLLHVFAISLLGRGFDALTTRGVPHPHLLTVIVLIIAVIAIATPVHVLIERPSRSAIRRLLEPKGSALATGKRPLV